MSLAVTLPITPRKKRAASLEHAALHDTFIKQEIFPNASNTPGAQDIPELDWVETPEPGDSFPCTPSSISTLTRALPADGKLSELRIWSLGETSSAQSLKAIKPSKAKQINIVESHLPAEGDVDLAKGIFFPRNLYTPSPAPKAEGTRPYPFMGDIRPENLRFLDPSASPPNFSKPNAQSLAAVRFALQNPRHLIRDHLQKRVRAGNERPRESIDVQSGASKAILAQSGAAAVKTENVSFRPPLLRQAPIKAQAVSQSLTSDHLKVNSKLTGPTNKRFTRILALNSIERLIESSRICIASLVTRPNVRCSMRIASTAEVKDRTLAQISELKNPLDLTVVESYIRGLIDSFTCQKHHHRIATKQLDALFDLYHDSPARHSSNNNDFNLGDLASLPIWLAALTRLPGEQTIPEVHIVSQTFQSKASACVQRGANTAFVKPETSELRQTMTVIQSTKAYFLDQSKTYSASQLINATSKFVSTQIIDIDFLRTAIRTSHRTSLAEERAKISFVESVNALEQEFRWFFPNLGYSAEHYIREHIYKTLTQKKDQEEGHIYMYWVVGSFNFVKIGYTSKPSGTRLKEWERKCGHKIQEFTAREASHKVWLPHVFRVETLVHTELREARLKEPTCKQCSERAKENKGHNEWFAVSAVHAQRVIDKWSNWMLTGPYVENKLRIDIKPADIDELCRPLPLSVRDTAAFAALRPLIRTEPPPPLLTTPRVRSLRPTTTRQRRTKSTGT